MIEHNAKFVELINRIGLLQPKTANSIYEMADSSILQLYETLYDEVYSSQQQLQLATQDTLFDPFSFVASASTRADATCTAPQCRIKKLISLARYAALYATTVVLPLPLSKTEQSDRCRFELEQTVLTLMSLLPLIEAGIVVPVVLRTSHCEHTKEFANLVTELSHGIADEIAKKAVREFKVVYQKPDKSPSGRATLYLDGPAEFLEHENIVMTFDHGDGYPLKSWRYDKEGKVEIGGSRKIRAVRDIINFCAIDSSFYLAFGFQHRARYLAERTGETLILEWFTGDDAEVRSTSEVIRQTLRHALPLGMDLPISTLLKVRRDERDAFERYRIAVQKALSEVASQKKHLTKKQGTTLYEEYIAPELSRMKTEIEGERRKQSRRVKGGLAGLVASVAVGTFAPTALGLAVAGAGAFIGGKLLGKALEEDCEHGARLLQNNDFYFLMAVEEAAQKS